MLNEEMGLVRIKIKDIIKKVITEPFKSKLYEEINDVLKKGGIISEKQCI